MTVKHLQYCSNAGRVLSVRWLYGVLAPRAYSAIIFGALFCNLAAKLFRAISLDILDQYFGWILSDIAVLLAIEAVFSFIYFKWPKRSVIRIVTIASAFICIWSVINAAWLIRTGTQVLPATVLPLFRDPFNTLGLVGVTLTRMPVAAVALLAPSAIALIFFFFTLAKPRLLISNRKRFINKTFFLCLIILLAVVSKKAIAQQGSVDIATQGLYYNCQLKAMESLIGNKSNRVPKSVFSNSIRKIPFFDEVDVTAAKPESQNPPNIIIIVLEGVQYSYTSLSENKNDLTPYLAHMAAEGVEFSNTHSTVTHTTKALFSLMTGLYPSIYHDLAEVVPSQKPYASIATMLENKFGFRTAFFQSAKGSFESRPSLIYNLGFDKFWSRDELPDSNSFVGYLGCDEFVMLKPIAEWIQSEQTPFLLTILGSVTHDPYVVPAWFANPAKEPVERYKQSIKYTDEFIRAIDSKIDELGLAENTIFCVIGDHGEAFGEHGMFGHERIAFQEALKVPWVIRLPANLSPPKKKITQTASSVDFAPTLLGLLGIETEPGYFDGINMLGAIPQNRQVYFSGWMYQGPAGLIQANRKFIYDPTTKVVSLYDLQTDPNEMQVSQPQEPIAQKTAAKIDKWRRTSIVQLTQAESGEELVFDSWFCQWRKRVCQAKYLPDED